VTLRDAILAGDAAAVSRALEDPDVKGQINGPLPGGAFGQTALLAAVSCANRDVIDTLLRAGADINQKSHWWAGGFHALDDAWKEPWLASFLIGRGAVPEIHHAVRLGMTDEVQRMLDGDSSRIRARGGDGQLPLHFAQSIEMADFLLSHGADVNARDVDHESTAAQWMIRDRQEISRELVSRGSEVDILMAAALGDAARVTSLLNEDPNRIYARVSESWFPKRDPRAGGTIYIWALGAYKTAHAVAREFERAAVLDVLAPRTPDILRLIVACEEGDQAVARELRNRHPDPIASLPPSERRAIADAAERNNTAGVGLMLEAGWPVNATGKHGATALHWAAFHGNLEMVQQLLRYDAPVYATEIDFNGTPLNWAEHGSIHGWHRATGDYSGTIAALKAAAAAREGGQS